MKTFIKFKINQLILILIICPIASMGQSQGPVSQMLRQDGKLWVVIAVIAVVLSGLIFYIWRLRRRVNRLRNVAGVKANEH